jgi:hypothetical protein
MGIPLSLLSISGLEAWCYEAHRFVSRCLARIRGTPFEGVCETDVRRGALCVCVGAGGRLGGVGASARVDARGGVFRRLLEFFLRS